jgi:hypothetical protein
VFVKLVGENICFEVMQNVVPFMRTREVLRARFSSLTPADLRAAMEPRNLVAPNQNLVPFVSSLGARVSYSPCSTRFRAVVVRRCTARNRLEGACGRGGGGIRTRLLSSF